MTEKYCLKMQHGMLNLKFLIQTMLRIFSEKTGNANVFAWNITPMSDGSCC